jgi:hypothetical protein
MMREFIQHFVTIKNHTIWIDAQMVYNELDKSISCSDFAKNVYKHFNWNYPKFFKMDELSKLTFMGGELLLQYHKTKDKPDEMSVVLMNRSASLQSDEIHQQSIQDANNYFPSPSVFVYTLPNVAIGELCIRHQITGENYFLVSDSFDASLLTENTNLLFAENRCKTCVAGWTELHQQAYELFLYSVEQNSENAVVLEEKSPIFAEQEQQPSLSLPLMHHAFTLETLYKLI